MTVASTVKTYAGPFTGDGVTTDFAVNFPLWEKDQVAVWKYPVDKGVDAVELIGGGVEYSVTGAGSQENPSMNGTVELVTALPVGYELYIVSAYDLEQLIDLVSQARFFPQTHESSWDYRTMIVKQIHQVIERFVDFDNPVVPPTIIAGDIVIDGQSLADFLSQMQELLDRATDAANKLAGVTPVKWEFTGDGTTTDFPLPGADLDNPLFYDVAIEGDLQEPYDEYTISGDKANGFALRFIAAPANTKEGWVILRGYAKPYKEGEEPITTVSPVVKTITNNTVVNGTYGNSIIQVNSTSDVIVYIPANTGGPNDFKDGDFFSVIQMGTGKVTVAMATTGTLLTLPGFDPKTRGQHSVISCSCLYADGDKWVVTGDLLRPSASANTQAFLLDCMGEEEIVTTKNNVYRFYMPYGFLLSDVRATINEAQVSGPPVTVDVKEGGVSIFSTKPTIDNGEHSSSTATTGYQFSDSPAILSDGGLVSIDVTDQGATGAKGLKVQLIGQRM